MKKRGLFSSKKAAGDIESYFVIIKWIIAFSAIIAMGVYVRSVVADTFYDKLYFSGEAAFDANTVYSAPGEVYYEYKREGLDEYNLKFDENRADIEEIDDESSSVSTYHPYATNLDMSLEKEGIENSNKIVFQKALDTVEIKKDVKNKLKFIGCPDIDTQNPGWKQMSFLIDFSLDEREDISEALGSIGRSLYYRFDNRETTIKDIDSTEDRERKSSTDVKGLIHDSDVVISLQAEDYLTGNNIKIYFSKEGDDQLIEGRKKFACFIFNELLSDDHLDKIFLGGNIVPVNPEYAKEEYEEILDNDKMGIVIEVGNLDSERIERLKEGIEKVHKGIYSGVEKYYE